MTVIKPAASVPLPLFTPVFTIAKREFRALFATPLAWVLLASVLFIVGYLFLLQLDLYLQIAPQLAARPNPPGITDTLIAPVLNNASVILLMVSPLLTMRLIAEERRSGTLGLLVSAPLAPMQIVIGKFVGMMGFWLVFLALLALMPLSLLMGGSLDIGKLAGGLLGLLLLLACFTATGLYISSLTEQPGVAAIGSFGVLLLLWIIDWASQASRGGTANGDGVLSWLSLLHHYKPMLSGLINSADLAYFVLLTAGFLLLAARQLDNDRLAP